MLPDAEKGRTYVSFGAKLESPESSLKNVFSKATDHSALGRIVRAPMGILLDEETSKGKAQGLGTGCQRQRGRL